MSEDKKKATVPVSFKLLSLQPDRRQYKPSNPLLEPSKEFAIIVDVPLDHNYIKNAPEIITAQLSGKDDPAPVFTPAGLKWIVDTFEAVMSDPEPEKSEDDLEWEETETSGKEKKSSDDWDEDGEELSWEEDEPDETDLPDETEVEDDVTWDDAETSTTEKSEEMTWDEEDL